VNAYNVPLSIYRNRIWLQAFSLYSEINSPLDVSQDTLALVVFPTPPVSGSVPVLANTAPTVDVNVVTFTTADALTGILTAGNPYTWQFLRAPYGSPSGSGTAVVVSGPLNVGDSPPFPYSSLP
jgi:hypothetical protein